MNQIVVTDVRPPAEPGPHIVLVGTGTMLGSGQPVTFAGDQRQMWDLRHLLDAGDTLVIALVEDWQIIGSSN